MSTPSLLDLKVPSVGESVTEVEVGEWLKPEGATVARDENLVVLETDKATMEVPAPGAGRLVKIHKRKGERVRVGDLLGQIDPSAPESAVTPEATRPESAQPPAAAAVSESTAARVMPAAAWVMAEKKLAPDQVLPTGPGGRVLKEDVERAAGAAAITTPPGEPPPVSPAAEPSTAPRGEERVPMSLMRRKIAERLVQAQQNAALLTTFNEVDMSTVMALRQDLQERFQQRYETKLGFMSFFVKAVVDGLKEIPRLNAEIRGSDIVYRNYFDIGVAIGGGRGLVVPVLRNAERLSFAEIELAIAGFARKARENKLRPEDLEGGTFTITNGGVYGSMLSTPLINPPQSGVLGMHAIQDRPVAVKGQVVVRPIMYVALTYDHRIVDGREAVTFLRRVKETVENPVRMLVEV
ncbi:MAG: 2-oxoglutarate dehydrogenase complex dihydrolipoyllysine-residue succinyltransferase [Verrucomicrobia bacterium]|nr:2-oxoglutarate dehydrogenase complex dihydrolipoyllysine-residue succinyltransferase [Verrucomicrobiota bacterium]